jgi:hypothetical protein
VIDSGRIVAFKLKGARGAKGGAGAAGHVTHSLEPENIQASELRGAKSVLGLLLPYATVAHKEHLQSLLAAY